MNDVSFGRWMKSKRQHLGLTQYDLERETGIARSHLSAMENNRIKLPDEDTRLRIHKVLGTTEDDLADVGILYRLESPVDGGGPVYLNPVNLRVFDADETGRVVREYPERYGLEPPLQRLHTLIDDLRLTTAQVDALVTILESFARPVDTS